jgi:hypothetical protein
MRNDMDSLNPGKACAQAAHAANEAVAYANSYANDILHDWFAAKEDGSQIEFGTTIVLEGSENEILNELADTIHHKNAIISSSVTIDPTYPIKDGQVMHHFPVMTCAWAWVETDTYKFNLSPMK